MIYYSLIYMDNGEIHLRPHDTKEAAEETCHEIKKHEKWGSHVSHTKVISKDPSSETYRKREGFWIS